MENIDRKKSRKIRHLRVRAKIIGTASRPRLCVFRSPKHIYAQLINDEKNEVLLAVSDFDIKDQKELEGKKENSKVGLKTIKAYNVGKLIAKKSLEKKIEKVVFDRGGYKYHGRIKALAEGVRDGGLLF